MSTVDDHDIWKDPDLAELLFLSEENRNNEEFERTQILEDENEILEFTDAQDPEISHLLYHRTLQPLLRNALRGASSEAKRRIRQNVNLLLKDGNSSGRDGKQALHSRMLQAIDVLQRWGSLCGKGPLPSNDSRLYRLYIMLEDEVSSIRH